LRRIQSTYSADARFLEGDDRRLNNASRRAFQQRSNPEVVEDRNRRRVASAKAAGEYRKLRNYDEPNFDSRIPIGKFTVNGTELPSLRGRNYGKPGAGGMMVSKKPSFRFGRFYGF
tara:strand:- start:69 stop:416 length:348 start_codon:yes stop_codon:yes gene_type:complete